MQYNTVHTYSPVGKAPLLVPPDHTFRFLAGAVGWAGERAGIGVDAYEQSVGHRSLVPFFSKGSTWCFKRGRRQLWWTEGGDDAVNRSTSGRCKIGTIVLKIIGVITRAAGVVVREGRGRSRGLDIGGQALGRGGRETVLVCGKSDGA